MWLTPEASCSLYAPRPCEVLLRHAAQVSPYPRKEASMSPLLFQSDFCVTLTDALKEKRLLGEGILPLLATKHSHTRCVRAVQEQAIHSEAVDVPYHLLTAIRVPSWRCLFFLSMLHHGQGKNTTKMCVCVCVCVGDIS